MDRVFAGTKGGGGGGDGVAQGAALWEDDICGGVGVGFRGREVTVVASGKPVDISLGAICGERAVTVSPSPRRRLQARLGPGWIGLLGSRRVRALRTFHKMERPRAMNSQGMNQMSMAWGQSS